MVILGDRNVCQANKSLLKNFPYWNVDIIRTHGQFNNSPNSDLPTKKYLYTCKLRSLHELDIFSLNTQSSINPDSNLNNQQIRSQYFSPHSFCKFRNNLMRDENQTSFSILHNNVPSLRRNFENLQVHLLDELDNRFSIIGITETKITNSAGIDFINPHNT